ncbi:MAG: hypothetical protein J6X34_05525 [Clostridia bacterium]|nr:hypothetical protein [Clostridia bacterium]
MKKILSLLTIALLGAAATAFSADPVEIPFEKFSVWVTPYENQNNQGNGLGGYYTVKMKSAGSLYITNFFNTSGDGAQEELLTDDKYAITHYGYIDSEGNKFIFDINDPTKVEQFEGYSYTTYEQPDPNKASILVSHDVPRDGFYLGDFKAEEEIQVYFARVDPVTKETLLWTATATPQDGVYESRFGGRTDAADNSMPVGQLYFPTIYDENNIAIRNEYQINFGIVASSSKGSAGQPLPGGVSIALVAGLFALGFWYVRRRKTVAV